MNSRWPQTDSIIFCAILQKSELEIEEEGGIGKVVR